MTPLPGGITGASAESALLSRWLGGRAALVMECGGPSRRFPIREQGTRGCVSAEPVADTNAPANAAASDLAWLETLIATARGTAGETWELRRIATLILEHEALRGDDEQLEWLCDRLGIRPPRFDEGYTATSPRELALQVRARLARNARVHDRIRGPRTSPRALAAFLHLARRECRLTFARELFTAEEIAVRIESQVRIAPAVRDGLADGPKPYASPEAPRTLDALPELERTLLRTLGEPPRTFWVGEETPSELNSLVEYPLGTVALTIKPPGSTHEFEIKRAGQRGPCVLGAACKPHQWTRSHYIRGASSKHILIWEASASAFVARTWRLVHGNEAPVSRTLYLANVTNVPSEDGAVNILRYFSDPAFHNGDFADMRQAIRGAVREELQREGGTRPVPEHDGPLTGAFVGLIHPGQAIMTGTSSFRLDVLARGLGKGESLAYAGELLDEVLCTWTPPRTRVKRYARYVAAALAANRERADACYADVLQQIGRFWGTMSALRIGSNGESFVPRNVGLRSVWEDGRWQLRVIFMDHDGMIVPGLQERDFHPDTLARPMMNDYRHIFGGRIRGTAIAGELAALSAIYRPRPSLERAARRLVRTAARAAYDTTMSAFTTNAELRAIYGERYVSRLRDWDTVVASYLDTPRDERESWATQTRARLTAAGYGTKGIDAILTTLHNFGVLIRKTAFFYRPPYFTPTETAPSSARTATPRHTVRPYPVRPAATSRSRDARSARPPEPPAPRPR